MHLDEIESSTHRQMKEIEDVTRSSKQRVVKGKIFWEFVNISRRREDSKFCKGDET
jgi:hypothetical protein